MNRALIWFAVGLILWIAALHFGLVPNGVIEVLKLIFGKAP